MNRINAREPGPERIGIIGTGPSGLVALKELKEVGLDVVAFDSQDNLGGVFSNSYDNLLLTGSDVNVIFGSFPETDVTQPRMWNGREYVNYLQKFAEHFDLLPNVLFSMRVEHVTRDSDGDGWRVTARSTKEAEKTVEYKFDRVVFCSGSNSCPNVPELPGQNHFRGRILHSSAFKNADAFRGKKVLIVGLGESGSDVALEVAKVASATAISSRRGPGYVIPRHFGGTVSDLDTNRCYHSMPYVLGNSRLIQFKRLIERFFRSADDDTKVLALAERLNRRRGFPWQQRFSTKSTNFLEAIIYHGAEYKCGIARLESDCVLFDDGTYFECDAIVLCTGFKPSFPFIGDEDEALEEANVPRRLYLRTFHPRLQDKAAWIGLVRPGVGAIPPCAEMQARYIARIFSGRQSLPDTEAMERDIHAWAQRDLEQFPIDAARVGTLTDYFRFMHTMGEHIGCNPPLRRLFLSKPKIWARVMFAPLSPVQFRLVGPGASPRLAEEVLLAMPTMPKLILAYEFLILMTTKILGSLGMSRYRPTGF